MSDFKYIRKDTDYQGHVMYYCKCSWCGRTCAYFRKISSEPLCDVCKTRRHNKNMWNREKLKPISELVTAVKGYHESYDQMPSMEVFDELVEAVIGDFV